MTEEKQIEEMAKDIACKTAWDEDEIPTINCLETAKRLYCEGYRKQSENEALEAIDKFRSALMDKFIDLCRGNDFNKINLLLIGETIDRTFDDAVAKMGGGAE